MSFYQNQNSFTVAVPTAIGVDVNINSGQVIEGDIYQIFAYDNTLTLVAGPYDWPVIVYSLQGSLCGGGGVGTITGVTAISPINGGGITGNVPVGLDSLGVTAAYIANSTITSGKIASGAVVKSLIVGIDGFTDHVELAEGTNIVLTPDLGTNTITIDTAANVVGTINATLPLSAITTSGVADISIDITSTNNGGAVALQSAISEPVPQVGAASISALHAADYVSINVPYTTIADVNTKISSLYLQPLTSGDNTFSTFDATGTLVSCMDAIGGLYTSNLYNNELIETKVFSLRTDPWVGNEDEKGHLTAVSADYANNFLNIPFAFCNTLTLTQVASSPAARVGTGNILGIPSLGSLISFGTTSTHPAIVLGTTSVSTKDLAFAIHNNGSTDPTLGLYTDGTITCKRVDALYLTSKSVVLTAGNYVVANYPGVSTFVIDSSSGVSTITLPVLDSSSEDGVILTFKKYDVTTNAVLISSAEGQPIDNDKTQYTLTTYKQSHGSTIGVSPEPILHVIRLMSVVNVGADQYFWISL